MTDKEAFNEFAKGVTLTIGVVAAAVLLFASLRPPEETPKENFAVVDTYKGCDVVRWALPSHAEYKYFLHCGQ
jgi:hypothetical protein